MKAVTFDVRVDWSNNASFGVYASNWNDANEDVSADVMGVSWSRGRNTPNDQFAMGTARVLLDNSTGKYNPYDSGAATWPDMRPGRRVRIEQVHDGVKYPAFGGMLADIRQKLSASGVPQVELVCHDGFDKLSKGESSTDYAGGEAPVFSLLTTQALIAGQTEWPKGVINPEYSIPASLGLLDNFVTNKQSYLSTMNLITDHEMGGQLFVGSDGKLTFKPRDYRSSQSVAFTLTGPKVLDASLRQSDYYETIIATGGLTLVDTENSILYTLNTNIAGRALGPTGDPRNVIIGTYQYASDGAVTPVAGTDFTANTAADGLGIDVTHRVTVGSFVEVDSGFTCTFDRTGTDVVYLSKFEVRGLKMSRSAEEYEVTVTNPDPIVDGHTIRQAFPFISDLKLLKGWAQMKSAVFNVPNVPPRLVVELIPRTDAEAINYLGMEISQRITVTNTTGLYPSNINEDFFIESIKGSAIKGGSVKLTVNLWHKELAGGNLFTISEAAGGDDNSPIVAGGATTGDRIAF